MKMIDGARVLEISTPGDYGFSELPAGRRVQLTRLAICRYGDSGELYLFACDKSLEVRGDSIHASIQEAKQFAQTYYEIDDITWEVIE